jgi:hypothetical protein
MVLNVSHYTNVSLEFNSLSPSGTPPNTGEGLEVFGSKSPKSPWTPLFSTNQEGVPFLVPNGYDYLAIMNAPWSGTNCKGCTPTGYVGEITAMSAVPIEGALPGLITVLLILALLPSMRNRKVNT